MNFRELVFATVDVESTVNFLQRVGLLHSFRGCPHCETSMRLKKVNSGKSKDGFVWRCRGKRCKKELGLRTGTFFSYLIEFMWRMKFKENMFETFVEHVKLVYPVN